MENIMLHAWPYISSNQKFYFDAILTDYDPFKNDIHNKSDCTKAKLPQCRTCTLNNMKDYKRRFQITDHHKLRKS